MSRKIVIIEEHERIGVEEVEAEDRRGEE